MTEPVPRIIAGDTVGPVDATVVPRYAGEATFARLPRIDEVPHADVAVLGVPFDSGVSYRPGARFGPSHIRESSRLLRPYNPALQVSPFAAQQVADAGDLAVNPFSIDDAISTIERGARALLERARFVLTLGGDHTVALPMLRALSAVHGPVAVVHFDAHLDTWDTYFGAPYTHGTPFRRASEEGLLDRTGCLHAGIRGPLYTAADLTEDTDLGFQVISAPDVDQLGVAGMVRAHPAAGRRPAGVRLGRHRRARPGARARHRHPGGGRPVQPGTAGHAAIILPPEPHRRRHRRGRARLRSRPDHRHRRRPRRLRAAVRARGEEGRVMSTTDEVLAAARDLVQAFGRHDTAAYFDCFAPDATFIFHTTAARLASRDEYQQLWRQWEHQDDFRVQSCTSAQPVVQDLGDAAVFSHDVTTVIRTRAGEQAVSERETIVFRRDGDRWAAVHEHLSPHPEPAA